MRHRKNEKGTEIWIGNHCRLQQHITIDSSKSHTMLFCAIVSSYCLRYSAAFSLRSWLLQPSLVHRQTAVTTHAAARCHFPMFGDLDGITTATIHTCDKKNVMML